MPAKHTPETPGRTGKPASAQSEPTAQEKAQALSQLIKSTRHLHEVVTERVDREPVPSLMRMVTTELVKADGTPVRHTELSREQPTTSKVDPREWFEAMEAMDRDLECVRSLYGSEWLPLCELDRAYFGGLRSPNNAKWNDYAEKFQRGERTALADWIKVSAHFTDTTPTALKRLEREIARLEAEAKKGVSGGGWPVRRADGQGCWNGTGVVEAV